MAILTAGDVCIIIACQAGQRLNCKLSFWLWKSVYHPHLFSQVIDLNITYPSEAVLWIKRCGSYVQILMKKLHQACFGSCGNYFDVVTCISSDSTLQWRHDGHDGVSITNLSIVCTAVCSGAVQRKHQCSASLAFVRGIHRWPVNSPHKGPVTR